jgi:hypothetical protein
MKTSELVKILEGMDQDKEVRIEMDDGNARKVKRCEYSEFWDEVRITPTDKHLGVL